MTCLAREKAAEGLLNTTSNLTCMGSGTSSSGSAIKCP